MRNDLPIRCNGISAFICRKRRGMAEYLLLRYKPAGGGFWQQVSGGIEKGETGWQAALREIREQTALKVQALYSTDKVECFYEAEKERVYMAPAFLAFVNARGNVRLGQEHAGYKWVTFKEAMKRLPYPSQREILKFVHNEFVRRKPSRLLRIHFDRRTQATASAKS